MTLPPYYFISLVCIVKSNPCCPNLYIYLCGCFCVSQDINCVTCCSLYAGHNNYCSILHLSLLLCVLTIVLVRYHLKIIACIFFYFHHTYMKVSVFCPYFCAVTVYDYIQCENSKQNDNYNIPDALISTHNFIMKNAT